MSVSPPPPLPTPPSDVLEDGQEEVFSRIEVEQGRIEHAPAPAPKERTETDRDLA